MLIFSVVIFVFSTLSLPPPPSPFASKSGGYDPSSYGSAAPVCFQLSLWSIIKIACAVDAVLSEVVIIIIIIIIISAWSSETIVSLFHDHDE